VADPAAPSACLNCGAPFAAPRPTFCQSCGQETTVRPPTLGEFAQQFGDACFSTEGALWRTLALSLFRPGELTRQYLAGRRRHYVLPLRLYLTVSVTVLLALRLMVAMQPAIDAKQAELLQDGPPSLDLDIGIARVAVEDGRFVCEGLPAWLCGRLQKRAVLDPQAVVEDFRLVRERLAANRGAAMFVLMPSFASGLWLLFRDRHLRYTEQLVFALHLHASGSSRPCCCRSTSRRPRRWRCSRFRSTRCSRCGVSTGAAGPGWRAGRTGSAANWPRLARCSPGSPGSYR